MDRKQLLEKIIAREAAMFIAVKASEPADCQEMLKTFYLMREMSHSVLAADTLTSYLQDLETAAAAGHPPGTASRSAVCAAPRRCIWPISGSLLRPAAPRSASAWRASRAV